MIWQRNGIFFKQKFQNFHQTIWLGALLLVAVISVSLQTEIVSDENDICRLFKDGTLLRMPGYCGQYIKCQNFKSVFAGECPSGKNFTLSTKSCGNPDKWDTYCTTTPCTAKTTGYVLDPKNCKGWYYCDKQNSRAMGFCGGGLYFDQAKQMCVYSSQTSCTAKFQFCDIVPPNVPFRDEDNCHKYFTCNSKGALTSITCEEGTYYDVATAKCIRKSLVNCYKHPIPTNACGTTKLAYRNRFVSDGATCRGYFYCHDLGSGKPDTSPSWGQCSWDTFFDPVKERCLRRTDAQCNEDRCDGRQSGRELAPIRGCQHYLQCENGAETGVFYCGTNMYFDAEQETCTTKYKAYGACS